MSERAAFLGVDVGTGSVRAGIFDPAGQRLGAGVAPIQLFRPREDFVEQSSDEIWAAVGRALRAALSEAGLRGDQIAGIGFDATCSLVLLDAQDRPVSLSSSGRDEQNVIVWMDHRATAQAERINTGKHEVLRYVGSAISPEMQTPKLLWLKEHAPHAFARTARFFDLPDFLTYRATGVDTRSLCSAVCKWTYLGREGRWDADYFRAIGLGELADEDFARIGQRVRPMGEAIAGLSGRAAAELGLAPGIAVGVSIIDAHAGGLGLLGVPLDAWSRAQPAAASGPNARQVAQTKPPAIEPAREEQGAHAHALDFDARLALIGGTSSCHMAVSPEPRFIEGIWGPYYSAMVPGLWLTEGGQSATGALIDHVVHSHARAAELAQEAKLKGTSVYALLNQRLERLAEDERASARGEASFPAALTRELHVYPDFHGNRSPRADPSLRGMISGLRLSDSVESLALSYLATIQAIAHGTRQIIASMNARGYRIDTLVACGGDTKNPVFVREHADITGCRLVLPREPEAVLLGAAMLGAVAAGAQPDLASAMRAMNRAERVITPAGGEIARYHERKHRVFSRMYEDQLAYRALMA